MPNLKLQTNPKVKLVFNNYPTLVRNNIEDLRKLVIETATEIDEITALEETLKWGEPSYLTKIGSTIRIDWKSKTPEQYAIYFKCTSRLIETFRLIFNDKFTYEGNRAIVFKMNDRIPKAELKQCIKAGLTYHKVKHLPTLGI